MEGAGFRHLWALLMLLVLRVTAVEATEAACTSYGVDYSNGGAYNIDATSNQYFTFITVFQGCNQETISPVLVGPDGNEYACSAIRTQPAGTQVTSTCGIPFSAMRSGTWKIIVSGDQIATQRSITLTAGAPQTQWITATPTVVVGYTITARPTTVVSTLSQTQSLILVPQTITANCNGGTRTVTVFPQGPTITVRSTIVRTATDGQVTSFYTTTILSTAYCHLPTGLGKREAVATAVVVAAVTSTYTQTTYTVTSTILTTIPARTTTELVLKTVTATITPAPSTVCANGNNPGTTVTVSRGTPVTVTDTSLIYQTTQLSGTLWVGETKYTTYTNQASATACWRAGGWFGA
ncbi:hypothetical protein B0H63DRAFT_556017 [Podospora didyma]|uniref:Uncharacterized protein n=1 Tax=Podospora didyma TaxID=330526 RepID=A0AAE0U8M9_9PEZI|nr:hypothetical protein B0H63DRAFT_556017 [Podospora didyma]